jgi:hypothetical protein
MLLDPNGPIHPVPYSIGEFAKETGLDRRAVLQRIADGTLKTVSAGADQRIPFSELRRTLEEVLDQVEEMRIELALALQAGLIKEVGVDERGIVVYERTEVPWPGQ